MLSLPRSVRIFVASSAVDMRRGHDGLFAIVREQWKKDPFTGHLFVFFGRGHDRAKILFWDRGGFVVYYKRLERGRFRWVRPEDDAPHLEVDGTDLTMLLDGIDVRQVRRPRGWNPSIASPISMDRRLGV
jgi:transposase